MKGIGKRIQYYLIGVILGCLAVYAIFGNRSDIGCDYFPNARVMKNIRTKALVYSDLAKCQQECLKLDSLDMNQIFAAGKVDFSESEPRKKPCGEYIVVTRLPDDREIFATVENCDSTATLLNLSHQETSCACD